MSKVEEFRFNDDGRFPNSVLPLLIYRAALPAEAAEMERVFAANGWSNAWRDGIFTYHHFHSIAHEVLGIAGGEVQVAFGGPGGGCTPHRSGAAAGLRPGRTWRSAIAWVLARRSATCLKGRPRVAAPGANPGLRAAQPRASPIAGR